MVWGSKSTIREDVYKRQGINSGFTDEDYEKAGAHILPSIEDVYGTAEMIIKVKEPIESEYGLEMCIRDRNRITFHTKFGSGLVHQVDGFVG